MNLIDNVSWKAMNALVAAGVPTPKPDDGGLPGLGRANNFLGIVAYVVLLLCLGAFLWGVGQWVMGGKSGNSHWSQDGKQKMIASVVGAMLVGLSAALINFFYQGK